MHEPAQKSLIDAGRWRISRGKCLDKVESINRVLLHVVVYERMESNLQPGCHHCQLRQHVSDTHHCLIDRKSTRLNSSHQIISYAVFCLKKKKIKTYTMQV